MPPKDAAQDWLVSAERDGVRLLTREENDFVILYASFQALLIIAVLWGSISSRDPRTKTSFTTAASIPMRHGAFRRLMGGGQGHRMYLEPPLDFRSSTRSIAQSPSCSEDPLTECRTTIRLSR